MPDFSFSFSNLIENKILRHNKIGAFLRILFSTRLKKEKFKSDDFQKWFLMMVLNLSFLKNGWNIDFIGNVPILMFLRILFSTRLKKEKFKSDDFQKWFLMIALNLSFSQIGPILLFFGSNCLKMSKIFILY